MRFFSFILAILFLANVGAAQPYYLIDGNHEDNGVVKMWFTTLGLLDMLDNGEIAGFEIAFENNGAHFEEAHGENWWKYYFNENQFGEQGNETKSRLPRHKRSTIRFKTLCQIDSERSKYLADKYLSYNSELLLTLNEMTSKFLVSSENLVGVYYQKPMMEEIQQAWDPAVMSTHVKLLTQNLQNPQIVLFTDDDEFAKAFVEEFHSDCLWINQHLNRGSSGNMEKGKYELLKLLLLSQCNKVIATGSYQSIGAKFINPSLQLIELDTIPYKQK